MTNNELIDRALFESYKGNWDKAINYSKKALENDPSDYLTHKRHALALWHLDQKDEAITHMKKSVELKPDFASAHYNLSCFFAQQQNKPEMLVHLQKAIDCDDYTDYQELAEDDDDFSDYHDDEGFTAIIVANRKELKTLNNLLLSDDYAAISNAILQIEKTIPIDNIELLTSYENDTISDFLEYKSEYLSDDSLFYLFKVVTANLEVDYFDGLPHLLQELQRRLGESFDDVLITQWKKRHSDSESYDLSNFDSHVFRHFKKIDLSKGTKTIIWGLNKHGKDTLPYCEDTVAYLLRHLPEEDLNKPALVNIVDSLLHGDQNKHDSLATREERLRVILPPSGLEYPEDSNDPFINAKTEIGDYHPYYVLKGLETLIEATDVSLNEHISSTLSKALGFAANPIVPIHIRLEAIEVIEKSKDKKAIASLNSLLTSRNIKFIEHASNVLRKHNLPLIEEKSAVDFLIELVEDTETDNYDLVDVAISLIPFSDPRIDLALIKLLNNSLEATRRETLLALGERKASTALAEIINQLRTGSGQCVTAAAKALDAIGGDARLALTDQDNFKCALEKAKKHPRWAMEALTFFCLEDAYFEIMNLLKTTDENEAFEHLAKGLAQFAKEESLPELITLGLDRYRAADIGGRRFLTIFRAIARKNGPKPDIVIVNQIKSLLQIANQEDLLELINDLKNESRYANNVIPTEQEKENQEQYANAFSTLLKPLGDPFEKLGKAMFSQERN